MITEIKLTPRRRTLLSDLNINNINDLINYYPRKYEDMSRTSLNKDEDNKRVVCVGQIYSEVKFQRIRNNLSKIQFLMEIDNETYTITIFNREYLSKLLYINRYIKIVGKLDYYHKSIVASNVYFDIDEKVITTYKLTEGIKEAEFKKIVKEGLDYCKKMSKCI